MSEPYRYHVSAYDRITGEQLPVESIKPVDGALYISWHIYPAVAPYRHPWKWYRIHRRMRKVRRNLRDQGYDARRGHHRSPR